MAKIFNMSEATQIAIHAIVLLARNPEAPLTTKQISEGISSSENHLSKVMQRLVKSEFVGSTRGPSGGFYLQTNSDCITLYDIYETIEGKLTSNKCPFDKKQCFFAKCVFDNKIHEISNDFVEYLKNTKISERI